MTNKLNIAVFPVAGYGTRFLPITKAMPKELLPVLDKPLIQHAVEEAVAAGIETLIFVGRNIEYFKIFIYSENKFLVHV